ncbi:hypothetical protein [Actinomadura rugatobispora]|uniref:Uncharacterized protein n=1 Tax=Actinomadura rugatobispora TaxID=1994 RepID=A0ABW1AB40_9ACTN|nr:hypothetical protein GCM10010200_021920 [Actinomadura rugatobispora]
MPGPDAGGLTAWEIAGVLAAGRPGPGISMAAQALAAGETDTFLRHLKAAGRVRAEGAPARWTRRDTGPESRP